MKKIFKVTIEEILSKSIEVEAEDDLEAMRIIRDKYDDEEIVLTADDFLCSDISAEDISEE